MTGRKASCDGCRLPPDYHARVFSLLRTRAEVIGERRASVTEARSRLKDQGVIDLARGLVTILDAKGLEVAACGCFRVIRAEFRRLFDI